MNLNENISAVVTGGASGLGEATARALAATGVKVALFDWNEERGVRVAEEISGLFAKVDVANPEDVAQGLGKARAAHDQERIMVCCAGIAPAELTVHRKGAHDPALFERAIRINLLGVFNCASQAAAGMVALDPFSGDNDRGVIINTASIAAYEGQIGQTAYAASKAGVAGLTLPMARDLSRHGIRVVAIAPGLFMTPMLAEVSQENRNALVAKLVYPRRPGRPQEFASMVLQACVNPMLNGEVIRLDGAYRMPPS